MTLQSDGEYHWYWGPGTDPEGFHGPFESGNAAQIEAQAKRPDGDYVVVEADKAIPDHTIFNAEALVAQYIEHNAGCWDEDGEDVTLTPGEKTELEGKLADCFGRWLRRHGLSRGNALANVRNRDYFASKAVVS